MESILERFSDNLTEVEYITNPAIARDEEIKKTNFSTTNTRKISCTSR